MMGLRRAAWLAWSASVALLAYPAGAQYLGQQRGILGSDEGMMLPVVSGGGASTVTLDAMPYTRTVTQDTYTVTGTFTGSAPTTWTASPSGDTGACSDTGGGTFSCVVDVDPDASGEGVETITIGTESVTIGFYVAGAHSAFLSQSVDGSYNSTLSDLDAVATWENVGTSALDVTQGTGSAQPTFRTAVVGGQPVVRCDGGDELRAATASDWTFLNDGADFTVEDIRSVTLANPATYYTVMTTESACGGVSSRGFCAYYDDRTTDNDRAGSLIHNGTTAHVAVESANDATPAQKFNLVQSILDDDGGAGVDLSQFCNGSACGTAARSGSYSSSAPAFPLTLCAEPSGAADYVGDLFRVLIYESALTSTQRAINQAVDEWALGQALPVVAPTIHLDSSYLASVTTAGGSVSDWRSTGILTASATAAGAAQPTHSGSGSTAQVDFDGSSDGMSFSITGFSPTASSWHAIAVVTPEVVNTNGTGASCYLNDAAVLDGGGGYRGILFRSDGATTYAIAYNYDSNADCAETTITLGGMMVIDASLSGGNVRIGVDGGALTSVASGNTGSIQNTGWVGWDGASRYMDGQIHELLWFPSALSTDARTDVIADLKTKWGIP